MIDKQIEEMARTLCGEKEHTCEKCDSDNMCEFWIEASTLYSANYRKQSEGENVTKMHPVDEFICEKCGAIFRDVPLIVIDEDDGEEYNYEFAFKFCPKCGMKVKGGEGNEEKWNFEEMRNL